VGTIDKAMDLLAHVEQGPRSLVDLVEVTGLSRATAHRLAAALVAHGLLRRTDQGGYTLGLRLLELGRAAADAVPLAELARPALARLRDQTGESAQLYVADGPDRVCVASLESPHGLRTIVPMGAVLSMELGSAGRVLRGETGQAGWLASVGEREAGVASVSAPVVDGEETVVAAVSVSGPIERLTRSPGRRYGVAVVEAAAMISEALRP
jgi:DNA-binding IclR family transcriptional regulator